MMAGSIRTMRKVPAFIGLLLMGAFLVFQSQAQRRLSDESPLDTVGKNPSQETGWEILKTFRAMGWDGGYRWRIQLKVMPRREKTRSLNGLMFGDRTENGPVSRIDLIERPADVDANGDLVKAESLRLLFQSGKGGFAMRKRSEVSGPPEVVDSDRMMEAIAGSDIALFDLMAPYVFWPHFKYEGRTTFRGGPTHLFWMYPPEEDALMKAHVSGVRLYINDQFNVLVQTEVFDASGKKAKTLSIIGIERVDGQVIFKDMDVRNDKTRGKTRLKIVDAEMGLRLPPSLFEPQSLMDNLQRQSINVGRTEAFEPVE
jgi:hypothetical protein